MALRKTKEPFRFTDLPGEIRNVCYEYLLCVPNSKVEISYQKIGRDYQSVQKGTSERFNKACLSLLLVNKAIKAEASHILYCRKPFVINIHIAYTSSDPRVGPEKDRFFKRQNKGPDFGGKGLISLACFRRIAHIEINIIYLSRPAEENVNTYRPFIVRKILHILADEVIEKDGQEGKTLKITHHPDEIGKKVWSGRQSFLQRQLTRELDGLLVSVRRKREVNIPDVPDLTELIFGRSEDSLAELISSS